MRATANECKRYETNHTPQTNKLNTQVRPTNTFMDETTLKWTSGVQDTEGGVAYDNNLFYENVIHPKIINEKIILTGSVSLLSLMSLTLHQVISHDLYHHPGHLYLSPYTRSYLLTSITTLVPCTSDPTPGHVPDVMPQGSNCCLPTGLRW